MDRIVLTELNYAECARYMGYGTSTPDETVLALMRECESEIRFSAVPRFVYKIFDIQRDNGEIRLAQTDMILNGESIRKHLEGCDKAILLCVTLSEPVDRIIRRAEISDMAKAVVMDAMAVTAIEQAGEKAEMMIREKYVKQHGQAYFTWRFGFGYGDLPLADEVMALKILDAGKTIGVNINESLIMFPRKSVANIIGISKEEIKSGRRGCSSCSMRERCKFRLRGEHCGF
ncbi:MAG: vitamin B12 dependent-methionine synthase activation domain-containing protein [Lachnospiraceae bacterium]|nr:vitamin B12 dependent-methionine synthase activation domain-containing protein [Lachnospiraceae bacterium]